MDTYETVVTRKGQITIPIDIRRSLGIKEGDRMSVQQVGGAIRVSRALDIVERTAGSLAKYLEGPAKTIEEEKAAFERGVAEEVVESMNR